MIFYLEGAIPAKKNSKQIFVNKKTHKPFVARSERYATWHDSACFSINKQRENQIHVQEPVSIKIELQMGDNRKRDIDNATASIFDTLKDCGIITDDSWQVVRRLEVTAEKSSDKSFYCKVTIDNFN